MVFCSNCGAPLDGYGKFCSKCGAKATASTTASAMMASPTVAPTHDMHLAHNPNTIPIASAASGAAQEIVSKQPLVPSRGMQGATTNVATMGIGIEGGVDNSQNSKRAFEWLKKYKWRKIDFFARFAVRGLIITGLLQCISAPVQVAVCSKYYNNQGEWVCGETNAPNYREGYYDCRVRKPTGPQCLADQSKESMPDSCYGCTCGSYTKGKSKMNLCSCHGCPEWYQLVYFAPLWFLLAFGAQILYKKEKYTALYFIVAIACPITSMLALMYGVSPMSRDYQTAVPSTAVTVIPWLIWGVAVFSAGPSLGIKYSLTQIDGESWSVSKQKDSASIVGNYAFYSTVAVSNWAVLKVNVPRESDHRQVLAQSDGFILFQNQASTV